MDYRSFTIRTDEKGGQIGFKSSGDSNGEFTGYAAVYGNEDRNGEVIDTGAMTRSINATEGEFPLLWQHQNDKLIGMVKLEDTTRGAKARGKLILKNPIAQQAYDLMLPPEGFTRGALREMSIGYLVRKDDVKGDVRHLKEIQILEVSLVTVAANPKALVTSVKEQEGQESTLQSLAEMRARIDCFEKALREIGTTLARKDLLSDPEKFHSLMEELGVGPGYPDLESCDPDVVHSLESLLEEQALYRVKTHVQRSRGTEEFLGRDQESLRD